MNWKPWKWFKKKKVISPIDMLAMIGQMAAAKAQEGTVCPPQQKASGLCRCIKCPIRATCYLEKMCYAADCSQTFVMDCGRRRELLGEDKESKKEEGEFEGGKSTLGTACVVTSGVCGESSNGRVRDDELVLADGKSRIRLDTVGKD